MRTAMILCLALSWAAQAQPTDSLLRPRVWLRADQGVVQGQWSCQGTARATTVPSVGWTPVADGLLNYGPTVGFDGTGTLGIGYGLEGLHQFTLMSVTVGVDTLERGLWGATGAATRKTWLTARRALGPGGKVDRYGQGDTRPVITTSVQSWTGESTPLPSAGLVLGATGQPGRAAMGQVAEFMVFDRRLDFLERIKYETYLGIKYGISLDEGNYVSGAGKVVWDRAQCQGHAWRVAGLGRDAVTGLYQRQGTSTQDTSRFLAVSIGKLAPLNAQNQGTMPEGAYIVWGDNGQGLGTVVPADANNMMEGPGRSWLLTATGPGISKVGTELHFKASLLAPSPKGYWLAIERGGTGKVGMDNAEYMAADPQSPPGELVFKNVYWDTDGSGRDGFALVKARDMVVKVKLKQPGCQDARSGELEMECIGGQGPYRCQLVMGTGWGREWKGDGKGAQHGLVAGDYTLTVTDSEGKRAVRTFRLSVPNALVVSLGADRALAPGERVELDAGAQVPDTVRARYEWSGSFGFRHEGRKATVRGAGVYQVKVTREADGCVFGDEVTFTGAEKARTAVYPTIVSQNESYNISISLPELGDISVEVFDVKGQAVERTEGRGQQEYHLTRTLKGAGIYLVLVRTPQGIGTYKVAVK